MSEDAFGNLCSVSLGFFQLFCSALPLTLSNPVSKLTSLGRKLSLSLLGSDQKENSHNSSVSSRPEGYRQSLTCHRRFSDFWKLR